MGNSSIECIVWYMWKSETDRFEFWLYLFKGWVISEKFLSLSMFLYLISEGKIRLPFFSPEEPCFLPSSPNTTSLTKGPQTYEKASRLEFFKCVHLLMYLYFCIQHFHSNFNKIQKPKWFMKSKQWIMTDLQKPAIY